MQYSAVQWSLLVYLCFTPICELHLFAGVSWCPPPVVVATAQAWLDLLVVLKGFAKIWLSFQTYAVTPWDIFSGCQNRTALDLLFPMICVSAMTVQCFTPPEAVSRSNCNLKPKVALFWAIIFAVKSQLICFGPISYFLCCQRTGRGCREHKKYEIGVEQISCDFTANLNGPK